jgi:hypothetical protein
VSARAKAEWVSAPAGRLSSADELLIHQLPRPVTAVESTAASWFDRFYFCLHGDDGTLAVLGAGIYPNADVIDGYMCAVHRGVQTNMRFADAMGADRLRTSVGPLSWEVIEPLACWRLVVDGSATGLGLDATWSARAKPWLDEPIAVEHEQGPQTEFAHYFQCGHWDGVLRSGDDEIRIDGWLGARDRSWGVRRTRERLGMHLWLLAQLEDRCVTVHYNEHRDGSPQHCDGAVLGDDGSTARIMSVAHHLLLDGDGELLEGSFELRTASGETLELGCKSTHRGLYMAGAGYGGWHGKHRDRGHLEVERWPLDGTLNPKTLSLGLTDKACQFDGPAGTGGGIVELALSRSPNYSYCPTFEASPR